LFTGMSQVTLNADARHDAESAEFSNLAAQISDTTCQLCGFFSSTLAGSEKCTYIPGAERKLAGVECTQCAQGSYKIQSGDALCTPCQSSSNTENEGSTRSGTCQCQTDLGWSLKPDPNPSVCEQIIQELGGQFELAVTLSDFANNVNNIQTDFTASLAAAFSANPANITLVYYTADFRWHFTDTATTITAKHSSTNTTGIRARHYRRIEN